MRKELKLTRGCESSLSSGLQFNSLIMTSLFKQIRITWPLVLKMDLIYLAHLYLVCLMTFVGEDKGMLLVEDES